jgi:hypothetical protein
MDCRNRQFRSRKSANAWPIHALLQRGEIPRGDAGPVTSLPERTARSLLSRLSDGGLIASSTPKGPVSLRFTTTSAETLFPRLFVAQG